ncbi:Nickel transporter NicT [Mycolicibacterium vinylchloridicum]|uniref:HoxN/HupN/NixA family nickel/cobalt transporter n=1 Tax=Mycolicibacterium vinylchloridicum TaxID=2736928 RepID=UPI002D7E4AA3|nr:HoxN/HupN/NixA family nickel/cobalt transporter [Mycolicibacterium vinylchloridicum]
MSEPTVEVAPRRSAQSRASLSRPDKQSLAAMYGFILLLHGVGFTLLCAFVVPNHYQLGGDHPVFTTGVGVLAYTFGLRHAFDADHIAAVDNTTRKLIAAGLRPDADRKPLAVGFWFSLGHSTIVFILAFLLAVGVRAIVGPVEDQSSTLHTITGVIGPSVSGIFLWIIGIVNLVALVGIVRVLGRLRHGCYDEAALDRQLDSRGIMNRLLGGLTKSVAKPWHIYPIGALFGLGFDTATEVGLLVLAGGAAAFSLPFYAILVLPILFAAGMCLMDTTDAVLMNYAYGWAFARPVRKIFYNMTITSISVAVALIVGTIELIGVLADRLHINSGPLAAIANVKLDYAGYAIVALLIISWLIAISVWRFGRIEQRWSPVPADYNPPSQRLSDLDVEPSEPG